MLRDKTPASTMNHCTGEICYYEIAMLLIFKIIL